MKVARSQAKSVAYIIYIHAFYYSFKHDDSSEFAAVNMYGKSIIADVKYAESNITSIMQVRSGW